MTTALVIVLFNPTDDDIHHLQHVAQLYPGVIVDNSETRHFESEQVELMHYIFLGGNKGIAHAQNVGIQHIMQHGPTEHIVFMDQDSRWEDNYAERITAEYEALRQKGIRLSALGPTVCRRETGEEYQSVFHKKEFVNQDFILRKHIISSGSCIRKELFGTMSGAGEPIPKDMCVASHRISAWRIPSDRKKCTSVNMSLASLRPLGISTYTAIIWC